MQYFSLGQMEAYVINQYHYVFSHSSSLCLYLPKHGRRLVYLLEKDSEFSSDLAKNATNQPSLVTLHFISNAITCSTFPRKTQCVWQTLIKRAVTSMSRAPLLISGRTQAQLVVGNSATRREEIFSENGGQWLLRFPCAPTRFSITRGISV